MIVYWGRINEWNEFQNKWSEMDVREYGEKL